MNGDNLPCYFCDIVYWIDNLYTFDIVRDNIKKQYPICRKCLNRIKNIEKIKAT